MERGSKYRIVHKTETQRYARVSVMTYLGEVTYAEDELAFDARPAGGTQTLRKRHIIAPPTLVPDETRHSLNAKLSA